MPPPQQVAGSDGAGAVELALRAESGALHALGTLDERPVAFVESGPRRIAGTFLFADGSELDGALWIGPAGPIELEVGERSFALARADASVAPPELRRYRDDDTIGGAIELSLQRSDGLLAGVADIRGLRWTIAGVVSEEGDFRGDFRDPAGARIPVRGRMEEGRLELVPGTSRAIVMEEVR